VGLGGLISNTGFAIVGRKNLGRSRTPLSPARTISAATGRSPWATIQMSIGRIKDASITRKRSASAIVASRVIRFSDVWKSRGRMKDASVDSEKNLGGHLMPSMVGRGLLLPVGLWNPLECAKNTSKEIVSRRSAVIIRPDRFSRQACFGYPVRELEHRGYLSPS